MKLAEAAAVLGVAPDADEEAIKAAHKKLIGQLHPDKGGSDYLAAKINDARRVMLEKRTPDTTKPDA
jgi:curved DNA-binding protein CbpA